MCEWLRHQLRVSRFIQRTHHALPQSVKGINESNLGITILTKRPPNEVTISQGPIIMYTWDRGMVGHLWKKHSHFTPRSDVASLELQGSAASSLSEAEALPSLPSRRIDYCKTVAHGGRA